MTQEKDDGGSEAWGGCLWGNRRRHVLSGKTYASNQLSANTVRRGES
jgi:hypothetical protein